MRFHPRITFGAMALFCLGLLATALFLQHIEQLEPCPLCILQRYAYLLTAFIALGALIQNPACCGRLLYGALVTLTSLTGLGVAVRQVWLIRHPALMCGPGLEAVLDRIPFTHWVPWLLRGTGDCAADTWRLFGLAIPDWSLLCFAALASVGLFLVIDAGREMRLRRVG